MGETVLAVLIAVVALPLLLYIPGWLISRLLLPGTDLLELLYERVLISALLSGWLALVLATFGVFSLWLLGALLLLLCGALGWLIHRRKPPPLQLAANRWELVGFALVGLITLLLVVRPSEAVLGARDAGVYANTGLAIARTGSLVQYDPVIAEMAQQANSTDPAVRGPAEQALANFLGVQHPERFIATRLHTAGFFIHEGDGPEGRIVPQHLHLSAAWIGLLSSLFGPHLGLVAPGLLGLLGAWSVGMVGRRLVNGWVGGLAFLFLALNSVQVWFARYPTSETTAQFLVFAGLYCFAKFQGLTANQDQQTARYQVVYAALAGLAIGQMALTRIDFFLAVAPLMAYLFYCGISHRWQRPHTALAVGLGAMLLHTALHIIFVARAYFFDTAFARLQDYAITSYIAQPFVTPLIREVYHTTNRSPFKDPWQIWRELALLGVALLVIWAIWRWRWPLQIAERWLLRGQRLLLALLAGVVMLLAGYAYLVRPQILSPELVAAAPSCLLPQHWQAAPIQAAPIQAAPIQAAPVATSAPTTLTVTMSATAELSPTMAVQPQPAAASATPTNPCLTLQGYVGAPIAIPEPPPGLDHKRMVPLANLVRVGWYLSPLGLALGVIGFALWWWRGFNRASWLFLVVGLLGTFFFVRDTYGTSDQTYIYILRRFVPIAYPTFSLSIAFALVALAGGLGSSSLSRAPGLIRRARLLLSGGLVVLLVAFLGWTGRPIYAHTEYQGSLGALQSFADDFPDEGVLLLRGGGPTYNQYRDVPDLVATPLRYSFGVNVFTVKSSSPTSYAEALSEQVQRWQAAGRPVYVGLSASGGSLTLPGFELEPAGDLRLSVPEFEQLTNQKPHNVAVLNLAFTIYQLIPADPEAVGRVEPPLESTDFAAQLQGFYQPEPTEDGQDTYTWTNGDALVRLPWTGADLPTELTLQVAGGKRPAQIGPAQVCLALVPETRPWTAAAPPDEAAWQSLGCVMISNEPQSYRVPLADLADLGQLSDTPLLLRLQSAPWVPAEADPEQHDQRTVGVKFFTLQ